MAKRMPLIKRVDILMGATSSGDEINRVYAKVYKVGHLATSLNIEEFYSTIPRLTQELDRTTPLNNYDISQGRNILGELEGAIRPIVPDMSEKGINKRDKKKKLEAALNAEYSLLKRFYEGEKRADNESRL